MILALSHGVLLGALGISGTTTAGAFAYGAVLGVTGMFFAALTAFFAQLTPSARQATGYSFMFLIGAYLVRAVGDQTNEILARISPLGLVMRAQVFVRNYWWPIFIILALAIVISGLAFLLNAKRDMDQGFITEKQGRATASALLRTHMGLAWRLSCNTLIAWAVGMFAFGAGLGGLMGDAEAFVNESEIFQMLMQTSPDFAATELFTMLVNVLLAIVCIAPVFILVFKLCGEEKDHRTENILSGAVSRTNYMAGYIVIGFLATIIMPVATTAGLWMVGSHMAEGPIYFSTMLRAMVVYVPALWVILGLAVLFVGILPKGIFLCWAYFGYIFIAGFFGDLLNMPEWSMRLSPFGFVPRLPLDQVNTAALLGLSAVAIVLTTLGIIFYKQRDIVW